MISQKINTGTEQKPQFEADIPDSLQDKVKSVRYISEIEAYDVIFVEDDLVQKIANLERKIERLTSENTLVLPDEPEIPYSNGITVKAGQIVVENGKKYEVVQPEFKTQESWRPSNNIPALWRLIPKQTSGTPEWQANIQVVKGEQYTFEGSTYEVIQSHTTQAGWTPPNVPALFSAV